MAITNRERVGKGLDLLTAGLQSFVEREMKQTHGDNWQETVQAVARPVHRGKKAGKDTPVPMDAQAVLTLMWDPLSVTPPFGEVAHRGLD